MSVVKPKTSEVSWLRKVFLFFSEIVSVVLCIGWWYQSHLENTAPVVVSQQLNSQANPPYVAVAIHNRSSACQIAVDVIDGARSSQHIGSASVHFDADQTQEIDIPLDCIPGGPTVGIIAKFEDKDAN